MDSTLRRARVTMFFSRRGDRLLFCSFVLSQSGRMGRKAGVISCEHRVSVGPVVGFRRLGAGAHHFAGEVQSARTVAAGGEAGGR